VTEIFEAVSFAEAPRLPVRFFLFSDSAPVSPSESFRFLSPTFVFSDALHVKYRNKVLCLSEFSILGKAHGIYIREFLRVWVLITAQR